MVAEPHIAGTPPMSNGEPPRPPLPPFDAESAAQKVRAAEDAWTTRDPQRVAAAYSPDSVWRNRAEFLRGRDEIVQFLIRKWRSEERRVGKDCRWRWWQ